jgi:cation diffusion facilitator family transporter
MHTHSLDAWSHSHNFLGHRHGYRERRTWMVVGLTAIMMVVEIIGGALYGSMALMADGWHMATHAGAMLIAAGAYSFARTHAHDPRFSFGTGKVADLAGFTSAVVLLIVALGIALQSLVRLADPVPIAYAETMSIALVGLIVNIVSARLLTDDDHHEDHHGHAGHHHAHSHHDSNLRAAYLHVLADALTSVLAIGALGAAYLFGWRWIDPAIGLLGALMVGSWSVGLLRSSSGVLLDTAPDAATADIIRRTLETADDRVSDLHVWRVGPGHQAAIISIVTHAPKEPESYKQRLRGALHHLSHITVEVNVCS